MHERRQHSRKNLLWQLDVHDLNSGERLGRIVDLSSEGFMIFSEQALSSDSVIQCRITCTDPSADIAEIQLGADCLWSRPGADGQHGWAGFHIIDLADEHAVILDSVLERLDTQ